jgi:hypothetical protein
VMSVNNVVGPNSTPTPPSETCVIGTARTY